MSLMLAAGALSAISVAGTPAARAATARPPAAPAVKAVAQPLSQVCTDQGTDSQCANREGGGTNPGTYVIAWPPGSDNNDFVFEYLTSMCGGGKVSANLECPFTPNKGLNSKYNGKVLAQIYNWDTGLCVADSGFGSGSTTLAHCGDTSGNGGADGTIFVLSNVTQSIGAPPVTYAVNRYWSNYTGQGGGSGTKARWLCSIGKGTPLYENRPAGLAGSCQWHEP